MYIHTYMHSFIHLFIHTHIIIYIIYSILFTKNVMDTNVRSPSAANNHAETVRESERERNRSHRMTLYWRERQRLCVCGVNTHIHTRV